MNRRSSPSNSSAIARANILAPSWPRWVVPTQLCSPAESERTRRRFGAASVPEWSGLRLDAEKNQQTIGREGIISANDSKLLAYTIPTDEELLIARDTVRVIEREPHPS